MPTNHATRVEVSQGHQVIRYVSYGILLMCYSNFVPKTRVFRYSSSKNVVTRNPGQRSRKVIESVVSFDRLGMVSY